MTEGPLEYVGGMTFGPAEGKPVISKKTLDDWLARARQEFLMKRMAMLIYNFTDEEMEEWARGFGTTDEIVDGMVKIVEFFDDWKDGYKAGIDMLESAIVRCIIIGERIEAQQKPN